MKIEVGKTYNDQEGNRWYVSHITDNKEKPFVAIRECDGFTERYTRQGTPYLGVTSFWDFVAEVVSDESTQPTDQELTCMATLFMSNLLYKVGAGTDEELDKIADLSVKAAKILQEKLK